MKKLFKILGIVLGVFVLVLFASPFLFKDRIKNIVEEQANANLNATVSFDGLGLSFFRNFPNATVSIDNLKIIGKGEFAKDTLVQMDEFVATIDLKSLFSDTGYDIKKLKLVEPKVYAHVLKDGRANWDITIPDTAKVTQPSDTTAFKMMLKKFSIEEGDVVYFDEESNMRLTIKNLNHTLSGDMSSDSTMLETQTTMDELSFEMDKITMLNKAKLSLDVNLGANFNTSTFYVSENKTKLNEIEIAFDGWVKMIDEGFDMNLALKAPNTEFKHILSMVPAIYAKDFADIKTSGKVKLDGYAIGKYTETKVPRFNLNMQISDAFFQYPALPKSVEKINVDINVNNPGTSTDATVVDIKKFAFVLGGNPFEGRVKLTTLTTDMGVDMFAKGKLNLGMIKEVYPLDEGMELAGILDADLALRGKMSYYDTNAYDKFFFDGKLYLSDMVFKMKELPHDLEIKRANLEFTPQYVNLPVLEMKIGKSDLSGSGRLENFIPYIFKNETLSGTLQTKSHYMNVDDFMSSTETTETTETAAVDTAAMTIVELPKNLNFTLNSTFDKVLYNQMDITNVKGTLVLADSKLTFKNLGLSAMGGSMLMNGFYSTLDPKKPLVDVNLKITDVIFTEVFKQMETARTFVPIFEQTTGRFSTVLDLKTELGNDMMPIYSSLYGVGTLTSKDLSISNIKSLQTLGSVLKREEFKNPRIKDLTIKYEIKNGRVYTKPFDIQIADTKIKLADGSTGMDETIDYKMSMDIPNNSGAIVKLNKVSVLMSGTFSNPKVKVDTKEMLQDAAATLKQEAGKKIDEAKVVVKEQVNQAKENIKEQITPQVKEVKENIKTEGKKVIDNIFKR